MRTDCSVWIFFTRSDSSSLQLSAISPQLSALLALRAEVGTTLRYQDAADESRARWALLSFLAINAMLQLEATKTAFRIDVVGDRGSPGSDGFEKYFLNRVIQPV